MQLCSWDDSPAGTVLAVEGERFKGCLKICFLLKFIQKYKPSPGCKISGGKLGRCVSAQAGREAILSPAPGSTALAPRSDPKMSPSRGWWPAGPYGRPLPTGTGREHHFVISMQAEICGSSGSPDKTNSSVCPRVSGCVCPVGIWGNLCRLLGLALALFFQRDVSCLGLIHIFHLRLLPRRSTNRFIK